MTKRPDPAEDDDAALFAAAVEGARPLAGARRVPPDLGARPRTASGPSSRTPASPPRTRSSASLPVEDTPHGWTARADGVDRRVLRRLRDGALPVEAQLDLHGLTRVKALAKLERFVSAARAAGRRGLLVIHGRGLHSGDEGPALARTVREALTEGAAAGVVLACTSAPPDKGGAGATLVYLRQ